MSDGGQATKVQNSDRLKSKNGLLQNFAVNNFSSNFDKFQIQLVKFLPNNCVYIFADSLRSIEWDLEDLDDTVQIVEKNPAKFRIDANDLIARKNFIKQTKDEVEIMKQKSSIQNKNSAANRFSEVIKRLFISHSKKNQ